MKDRPLWETLQDLEREKRSAPAEPDTRMEFAAPSDAWWSRHVFPVADFFFDRPRLSMAILILLFTLPWIGWGLWLWG